MGTPEEELDNLVRSDLPQAGGDVLSATLSDASNPEALLKMEQARRDLQTLQLKEIADLLPVFKQFFQDEIQKVKDLQQAERQILKELMELHELWTKDVETEFEILKAFESQITLIEPVRESGNLPAVRQPNARRKK